MSAANDLTSEQVTVTAEELAATVDVLSRLTKITTSATQADWYVIMAARIIISRTAMIAKYGSVPGE